MSLLWTTDSDGERIHRLEGEWDGNKGPWWEAGGYRSEADRDQFSIGTTWSRWGLGVEFSWHHGRTWNGESVDYRDLSASLTLGPWYIAWTRVRPIATPSPGASS
jgi:hypothetical protein